MMVLQVLSTDSSPPGGTAARAGRLCDCRSIPAQGTPWILMER